MGAQPLLILLLDPPSSMLTSMLIMMGRLNPPYFKDARLLFNRARKKSMTMRLLVTPLFALGALAVSQVLRARMRIDEKTNNLD